jgi:hypothetical protein
MFLFHPDSALAKDAKPKPSSPAPIRILDQKRIHAIYSEGDFEGVIASIDSFTQANKTFSQSDSVFIAKHLAVVYTANPATREKGKNYMFRLLALLPSAKIVDMFVSDEIDHIFEKVREEYVVRRESLGMDEPTHLESNQYAAKKMTMNPGGDSVNGAQHAQKERQAKAKTGSSHAVYWVAGGVTLVAVAGSAWYLLQPKKPVDEVYDIPK